MRFGSRRPDSRLRWQNPRRSSSPGTLDLWTSRVVILEGRDDASLRNFEILPIRDLNLSGDSFQIAQIVEIDESRIHNFEINQILKANSITIISKTCFTWKKNLTNTKRIMSSLYPTLEDMRVDEMARQQVAHHAPHVQPAQDAIGWQLRNDAIVQGHQLHASLYPQLGEYMGMDLSQYQMAPYQQPRVPDPWMALREVGPVTGAAGTVGLRKAEIKQGLREVRLCKDAKGMVGLRVENVNNGIFICFVQAKSPAAMVGLRFGDQILQIDGITVAGWGLSKVHDHLRKNTDPHNIAMVIRDRPFDRTITMHKDSANKIGFLIKNGRITDIVADSSAARNGILTDHAVLEIDGQNCVGMKDKEIAGLIDDAPRTVTVTIMPSFVYDHMMKHMKSGLVRKEMDHSIPDV